VDAAGRRALIEKLCSFKGRWPGTYAERRAAEWLVDQLRGAGRKAELEPTYVQPEYSLAIAIHVVLAIAGSLVALVSAPIGFAMVLLSAFSLYLDQNTRLYVLRSLLFRRASQNVVSPGPSPDAPARVILSAHYDAAKTGYVFGPRSVRAAKRLSERARVLLGPIRLIFWVGIVPLLLCAGLRMAGVEARWLDLAQLFPTVVLLITFVLLIDIALSEIVPGAYDNASGVAAVLSAAAALDAEPPQNLDVWVVLPGAEECNAQGMARYVAAHRKQLDPENTYFVNIDSVSFGTVHYLASEGAIVSYGMDRRLLELCEAIASAERDTAEGGDGPVPARSVRIPTHTDALPARARRLRAISILGLQDGLVPPYYHTPDDTPDKLDDEAMTRAVDFTLALVGALDRDVGRIRAGATAGAHQV
jgi:hypothetical protein